MANAEEQRTLRYSAFISYSHFDSAFAQRLHRRLENYRLPRRLTASRGTRTNDRRRLRPIFRDRDELTAAPDLSAAVQDAIADSSALIVVCSESSRQSDWVGREVALFRQRHGDGAILAVLSEDATAESFPAALRRDGPDEQAHLPLAADFRSDGDGARLALLKLVAVLAGVRLDELVQRDAQRRIRKITLVSVGALAGMAVMGVLTLMALNARAAAERELARSGTLIEYLLSDLRGRLKAVGRLDLLDAVNKGATAYYSAQDLSNLPVEALVQRAKLLQAIGEDDASRGKFAEADAQFEEAERTTAALLKDQPNDDKCIFAHAQSEYWIGFASWRLGNYSNAETAFKAYAELAQRLVNIAPGNPDWSMEMGYADSNLGMFLFRQIGDLKRAEPYFTAALADFVTVAQHRPADMDVQAQIADGYGWLGDIERLRGNCNKALADRDQASQILTHLLERDPRNAGIQTTQVYNDLALARVYVCQGALSKAVSKLDEGRAVATALAKEDPENADIRKEIRMIDLFRARTWMMLPINSRPTDSVIAEALGNCNADSALPNNQELATFCIILQARRLEQIGDSTAAKLLMKAIEINIASPVNKLSPRWGINFRDEIDSNRSPYANRSYKNE
jgi:tetratricopeptide (TPR) repeat protein